MSKFLRNPTLEAPIDTVSGSQSIVIPCGETAEVTDAQAAELKERYPFLELVEGAETPVGDAGTGGTTPPATEPRKTRKSGGKGTSKTRKSGKG